MKKASEWTDWIPVPSVLEYSDGNHRLPVPHWMQVMVKSEAGKYPDIEYASYFAWEPDFGPYSLIYYKVRLH